MNEFDAKRARESKTINATAYIAPAHEAPVPYMQRTNSLIVSLRIDVDTLTRLYVALHEQNAAPQNAGEMLRVLLWNMAQALHPAPATREQAIAFLEFLHTQTSTRTREQIRSIDIGAFTPMSGHEADARIRYSPEQIAEIKRDSERRAEEILESISNKPAIDALDRANAQIADARIAEALGLAPEAAVATSRVIDRSDLPPID